MKKISEYINHYLHKNAGNEEKIESFSQFIENFFANIDDEHSIVHVDFSNEIENFTEEVDTEMITAVVANLRHKDGTLSGEKWNIEEVKTVVKQYDVKNKIEAIGKMFDCHKFWLSLNYAYATHYSINRTINGYIDLAIDEYTNRNICFETLIKKIFEKI
jgi:recombinational DNA repair protein RecT